MELVTKELCCGCESCRQACPLNCIKMLPDKEGFLYPLINNETCIECGQCRKACPSIK